ncbi:MAG: prolyl oligopeptidase family serine peptidase, partial [Betaproteobacteria bacterium]|nr:prolyl oligopeptidase family serine peptidase [Betaproteobacteria bacterium]
ALEYLASRPEIDPARIGVMGFSWGGMLSIVAATDRFTTELAQGKRRFKAHLALYPVCWIHGSVLEGTAMASPHKFMRLERDTYSKVHRSACPGPGRREGRLRRPRLVREVRRGCQQIRGRRVRPDHVRRHLSRMGRAARRPVDISPREQGARRHLAGIRECRGR